MLNHILYEIGLWIILVVEFFFALLLLSFFLFGGRVKWSIELNGPLEFMLAKNHAEEDGESE